MNRPRLWFPNLILVWGRLAPLGEDYLVLCICSDLWNLRQYCVKIGWRRGSRNCYYSWHSLLMLMIAFDLSGYKARVKDSRDWSCFWCRYTGISWNRNESSRGWFSSQGGWYAHCSAQTAYWLTSTKALLLSTTLSIILCHMLHCTARSRCIRYR